MMEGKVCDEQFPECQLEWRNSQVYSIILINFLYPVSGPKKSNQGIQELFPMQIGISAEFEFKLMTVWWQAIKKIGG
jgi:hypothetical protein